MTYMCVVVRLLVQVFYDWLVYGDVSGEGAPPQCPACPTQLRFPRGVHHTQKVSLFFQPDFCRLNCRLVSMHPCLEDEIDPCFGLGPNLCIARLLFLLHTFWLTILFHMVNFRATCLDAMQSVKCRSSCDVIHVFPVYGSLFLSYCLLLIVA